MSPIFWNKVIRYKQGQFFYHLYKTRHIIKSLQLANVSLLEYNCWKNLPEFSKRLSYFEYSIKVGKFQNLFN